MHFPSLISMVIFLVLTLFIHIIDHPILTTFFVILAALVGCFLFNINIVILQVLGFLTILGIIIFAIKSIVETFLWKG